MSFGNPDLDRAVAVANAVTVRPDRRCFCRISSAAGLREITPRVAQALRLAKEATPHLQRCVLLARKQAKAQALGTQEGSGIAKHAAKTALAAIPEALLKEIEALQEELRINPPTDAEREFLEAAAFGTYRD